ncbi:MAG TPA: hypothetical protein VHB98_18370 [Chloroflexota bacterium]|nr:hypothetical protein [Chloroflexota bacterium]
MARSAISKVPGSRAARAQGGTAPAHDRGRDGRRRGVAVAVGLRVGATVGVADAASGVAVIGTGVAGTSTGVAVATSGVAVTVGRGTVGRDGASPESVAVDVACRTVGSGVGVLINVAVAVARWTVGRGEAVPVCVATATAVALGLAGGTAVDEEVGEAAVATSATVLTDVAVR